MTQIIARIANPVLNALGTLADNTSVTLDGIHATSLLERKVLFEYESEVVLVTAEISEFPLMQVCLIDDDVTDTELDTLLKTTIQKNAPEDAALQQRLKAIGTLGNINLVETTSGATKVSMTYKVHFRAPKGVPYETAHGWKTVIINRSGGALTTGSFAAGMSSMSRYAYVR